MIGHDELVLLEEHVTDGDGFVEETAGIPPHVEDESVERVGPKLLEGLSDFAVGCFVKLRKTDVPDAGFNQEGDVYGVTWDLVTRHGEEKRLSVALTSYLDLDHGALRAL